MLPTGISVRGIDIAILFMQAVFGGGGGRIAARRAGRAKRPTGGDGVTRATKERRERGAQPPLRPRVPRAPARDFSLLGVPGVVFERSDPVYGVEFSLCDRRAQSFFVLDLPRAAGRIGQFPVENLRLARRSARKPRKTLRRILRTKTRNWACFDWYRPAKIGSVAGIFDVFPYEDAGCCTILLYEEFFVLSPKYNYYEACSISGKAYCASLLLAV